MPLTPLEKQLRDALAWLLTHPGIADMTPDDKDPEDHALERVARNALAAAREKESEK